MTEDVLAGLAGIAATIPLALIVIARETDERAKVRASLAGPRPTDDVPRRPAAWGRRLRIAVVAGAAALGGSAVAGPAGAIAGGIAGVVAPSIHRRRRSAAERVALEDGLADAVAAIAAAIRAGRSMAGALDEAAATVAPPLGPRLAALVDRVTLGVPVERAVLDLPTSVPGPDGRLVAAVLGLHQRSGGDVPAVLDRVARTLRERRASAREVRSLTAQARLSGAILGFLPIGFFLFLSVTARADVDRALSSSTGLTAIVAGLLMQGAAFLWIRRLLRVDA